MKFSVVALAAGLLVWAGGAQADQALGRADSGALLGPAVSTDVLNKERGMSGIAFASQDAEQNVINKIKADGSLELDSGMVVLNDGALMNSNMNMIGINTGQNAVMNFQFLVNVYVDSVE